MAMAAAPSPPAVRALANWVEASSRRRSTRSASVPATGASTTDAPARAAVAMPTTRALSVISYTSHSSAMRWAHIPVACRNWAPAYRRKLRLLRASTSRPPLRITASASLGLTR